jgi:sugar-specific transcriptional regulator TrmB
MLPLGMVAKEADIIADATIDATKTVAKSIQNTKNITKLGSEFTRANDKSLMKLLNVSRDEKFHTIKKEIIQQAKKEIDVKVSKQLDNNPDIWLSPDGRIGLQSRINRDINIETTLKIEMFSN